MIEGILGWYYPNSGIYNFDEIEVKNSYNFLNAVIRKFVSEGRRISHRFNVVVIKSGIAHFFEDVSYFYNVILPSVQKSSSFTYEFLCPHIDKVVSVLNKDEKWMVFGPFLTEPITFEVYHIMSSKEWKDKFSKDAIDFISEVIRESREFGICEFDIASSPFYGEEIDIYSLPSRCEELIDEMLYDIGYIKITKIIGTPERLYLVNVDDLEYIFDVMYDSEAREEFESLGKKFEINRVEIKTSKLLAIETTTELVEYLLKLMCKLYS